MDFKKLDKDGESFELLCRDLLESLGIKIISNPSRGPDQKKDMIIEVERSDPIGNSESLRYLVQCKHKAHSGKSVYETELGDFRSACMIHNVQGYFLITTTLPSSTVSQNLEIENTKGNLKTIIWDYRRLEQKIINSPISTSLLEKYRLKEDLDILFQKTQEIMLGEYHLPFELFRTINENEEKGFIFHRVTFNAKLEEMDEYLGYFCSESIMNQSEVDNLKFNYNLTEIRIISCIENNNANHLTVKELYRELQSFRDEFYQRSLVILSNYCEINPALIRMLESVLSNIPYEIQPVTINFLENLINLNPAQYGVLIIREAAQTIAKLGVKPLKVNIFNQLNNSHAWEQKTENKILLAENLIDSLIKMEGVKAEYTDEMLHLFERVGCSNIRLAIVKYFIHFKIRDERGIIKKFFSECEGRDFPAHSHAIGFLRDRVSIVYNQAPLIADSIYQSYLLATSQVK